MRSYSHPSTLSSGPGRLLFTALATALLILSVAGCHVGSLESDEAETPGGGSSPPSTPGVDSGAAGEGGADGGGGGGEEVVFPDACVNFAAAPAQAHAAGYDYNEGGGQGCLGMCHKDGADQGEVYTLAGAVYTAIGDGAGPVAGAHVFAKDAEGTTVDLITSETGEFATAAPLVFPVQTLVTGCPDRLPMLALATGNCTSAAPCHASSFRINHPAP